MDLIDYESHAYHWPERRSRTLSIAGLWSRPELLLRQNVGHCPLGRLSLSDEHSHIHAPGNEIRLDFSYNKRHFLAEL